MSVITKLPIDVLIQITDDLAFEDLINLRSTDKTTLNLYDNKNFLNPLSLRKIGTCSHSFNQMSELYHHYHISYNSPKYFSINECLQRCGRENNLDYARFFKEKGASNYDDFLISACEHGNLEAANLALNFAGVIDKETLKNAIIAATKGGHLFMLFQLTHLTYGCLPEEIDLFAEIAENAAKYNHFDIVEWVMEKHSSIKILAASIVCSIKQNNFEMLKLISELVFSKYPHKVQYLDEIVLTVCIKSGTLGMFEHLINNCIHNPIVSMINDGVIVHAVKVKRFDIINYLFGKKVVVFDQFQWDLILLNASFENVTSLMELSILNGGKLYKIAYTYFVLEKRHDLVEHLFEQEDIYTNIQTKDYLLKLYFGNRNFNITQSLIGKMLVVFRESLFTSCCSVSCNDLLLYSCQIGNKRLVDKALNQGANVYKMAIYAAHKSGDEEMANYLFDKWKCECKSNLQSIFHITNYEEIITPHETNIQLISNDIKKTLENTFSYAINAIQGNLEHSWNKGS
jgi:hypothetical protein